MQSGEGCEGGAEADDDEEDEQDGGADATVSVERSSAGGLWFTGSWWERDDAMGRRKANQGTPDESVRLKHVAGMR